MQQLTLSRWLKAILAAVALGGLILCFAVVPAYGRELVGRYPEFRGWYLPWLIFAWLTALPCFAILVVGWKVADRVGKGTSFSRKNAGSLAMISRFSLSDAVIVIAGSLLLLFLGMNHPGVVILTFLAAFAFTAVSAAAAALSHLARRAAELQEQSDLTI